MLEFFHDAGYNTSVMNAPSNVVFQGHSTGVWAIAVSAFAVGAPLGANVAGDLADTRGRRGALLLCTWTFMFGGLVQTFAMDMFSIIVARFIIGIACLKGMNMFVTLEIDLVISFSISKKKCEETHSDT